MLRGTDRQRNIEVGEQHSQNMQVMIVMWARAKLGDVLAEVHVMAVRDDEGDDITP